MTTEGTLRLIGGVAAGERTTVAAVADESGRVLGRASGPAADLIGIRNPILQRTAIVETLAAARAAAGVSAAPLSALVIGIAGYDEGVTPPLTIERTALRVAVMQHIEIAQVGALGGLFGIVVIAGTGGAALGTAPHVRQIVRAGGWGEPFAIDGGACWLGREAIRSAMATFDSGEPSRLGKAALSFFGVPTLRVLQHAYARGEITPLRIAAFARVVLELATRIDGFPDAMDREAFFVRTHAAHVLVGLAMTVDRRLPACTQRRFSFAGELFDDQGLQSRFAEMLVASRSAAQHRANGEDAGVRSDYERVSRALVPSKIAPHLRPVPPVGDALAGAIVLARGLLGREPAEYTSSEVIAHFAQSFG